MSSERSHWLPNQEEFSKARTERGEVMKEVHVLEERMRRFIADASHELRTPLSAISAYAELFERGGRERPDDLERLMSGIRTETARMAKLIDDLLVLVQLDENYRVDTEEVRLGEVLMASVDAAQARQPTRQFGARIDAAATVQGDPTRLRRAIDNLFTNVCRHTPISSHCAVTLESNVDEVVLSVRDEGPGVSAEQLPRLCDRFYRVDTARSLAKGGNGLGLSITKAVVEAHGGSIALSLTKPAGLTVTVILPAPGTSPLRVAEC